MSCWTKVVQKYRLRAMARVSSTLLNGTAKEGQFAAAKNSRPRTRATSASKERRGAPLFRRAIQLRVCMSSIDGDTLRNMDEGIVAFDQGNCKRVIRSCTRPTN